MLIPFLMKPKSYLFRALGKYKFSNRSFRFIFEIGLDSLWKQSFLLAPRRLGRFFLLVKRSKRGGTAQAFFAGYGLDYCKFLRVVHVWNIFKKASFQRHVTAYNYPLKRRKSLFWGPKFHNFPGEHSRRPRKKKDRFAPGDCCIGSVFWEVEE